jgi:hypothetical protein
MDFPSSPPSPGIQHSPTFGNVEQTEQQTKQIQANEVINIPQALSPEAHLEDIDEIHPHYGSEEHEIEENNFENHFQEDDIEELSHQRVIDMDNLHEAMADEILNSDSIQEILPDRVTPEETNEDQTNVTITQEVDAKEMVPKREATPEILPEVVPEPEIQENFEFNSIPQAEVQYDTSHYNSNQQFEVQDVNTHHFSTETDPYVESESYRDLPGDLEKTSNNEAEVENDFNQDDFSNLIKEASSDSIFQERPHSVKSETTTSSAVSNRQLQDIESTSVPSHHSEEDEIIPEAQNVPTIYDEDINPIITPDIESETTSNFFKQAINSAPSRSNQNKPFSPIQEKRPDSPSSNQQYTLFFKPYEPTPPPSFPTFFYMPKEQDSPFNRNHGVYGSIHNDSLKPSQSVSDIDKIVDSSEKPHIRTKSLPPIPEPIQSHKIDIPIADNEIDFNVTSGISDHSKEDINYDLMPKHPLQSNSSEPHRPTSILTSNIHNDQLINDEERSTYHTPSSVIKSGSNEQINLNNAVDTSPYYKNEELIDSESRKNSYEDKGKVTGKIQIRSI